MSAALYDVPGPRARRRIRIATAVSAAVLLALTAAAVVRLASYGQFEAARWRPFTDPGVVRFLLFGLVTTVRIAVVAMVLSLVIGTLLALGRLSRHLAVRLPATAYVQFFRSVPLIVLILFAALGLPKYGLDVSRATALVIGLTAYNSAVIAELVRAGILSVERGQREAALAVGLTDRQAMWLVVLPQAVRRMLPTLVTQLVTILKDTSLGFVVSVEELLRRFESTGNYYPNTLLQAYFLAALVYIAVNLTLTRLARRLERRQQRRLGGVAPATRDNEDLVVLRAEADAKR